MDTIEHFKRLKHLLEINLSNKKEAYEIDAVNLDLNIHSTVIIPYTKVVPETEWYVYTIYSMYIL